MVSLYNAKRDIIRHYNSPEELLAAAKLAPEWVRAYADQQSGGTAWAGCSGEEAVRRLTFGDKRHLPRAEALIEKMKDEGIFSHGQKIWESSVVGSFPCVPHAVMGLPDTMYKLCETDLISTTTPLRIYVNVTMSGMCTTEQIVNRGVAILGLVMAMQQVRPTELYAVCISDPMTNKSCAGTCTRIETTPLDLDRATYMLCDPSFPRQIGYGMCFHLCNKARSSYLPWAWGQPSPNELDSIKDAMSFAEDDLYLPGMFGRNEKYVKDPVGWIKDYLEAHKNHSM